MPDAQGAITAGQDDVQNNVSPVNPANVPTDMTTGTPGIPGTTGTQSPVPPPQPPSPTQQPSFFRTLLYSLGKGLLEGTQAGLEAPRTAQGPAVAAANAPNIPVQAAQRQAAIAEAKAAPLKIKSDADLKALQIETAQVNLAMAQHNLIHIDDARVDDYFKEGQKNAQTLINKGDAESIATGSRQDINDKYIQQRNMNPDKHYMAYPNPGSARGDKDEYMLIQYEPDNRFDGDGPDINLPARTVETPDGQTLIYPAVKIPGPKEGQPIKAYNAAMSTQVKMQTIRDNDITRSGTIVSRESEGTKNRASRERINANNVRRSAAKDLISANNAGDRTAANLLGKVVSASSALARLQDEFKNKAESALTPSEAKSIDTATSMLKEAQGAYDTYKAGRTNQPLKVITPDVVAQYKQKAGGDPVKARKLAIADGYDPASFGGKK